MKLSQLILAAIMATQCTTVIIAEDFDYYTKAPPSSKCAVNVNTWE
jgi:hypothetical protein